MTTRLEAMWQAIDATADDAEAIALVERERHAGCGQDERRTLATAAQPDQEGLIMSVMDNDPWGLALGRRAHARGVAYYRGLDDAIDGKPSNLASVSVHLWDDYRRGYGDGLAQLATFPYRTPVTNPARDND